MSHRSPLLLTALAALALAACEATPPPAAPSPPPPAVSVSVSASAGAGVSAACPDPAPPVAYVPKPAPEGPRPDLPSPDAYVPRPVKAGDAFTVWGAAHHLRSRVHHDEVAGKRLSVVGWIVRTNYDAAPKCALHRVGKGDPASCRAPVPTFSIADEKDRVEGAIDVMGWASNFAQVFTLIEDLGRAPRGQVVKRIDEFWGIPLPNPLPAVGAKVKVTGTYDVIFTKAVGGAVANPKVGILTAETIETLEPAPAAATLPGMKKRGR